MSVVVDELLVELVLEVLLVLLMLLMLLVANVDYVDDVSSSEIVLKYLKIDIVILKIKG